MKRSIALGIFLSVCNLSYAQDITTDVNSSTASENKEHKANNSNSGNLGIYNVDLYSGTASVNIPIYDYSIDGLQLGVSLSYDTRGIHVDQPASSCGLGWNLDAGGYITRDVHGIEDDQVVDGFGPQGTNPNSWPKSTRVMGKLVGPIDNNIDPDKELDVFEAHFAGRSVKFHLKELMPPANAFTYPGHPYPTIKYRIGDTYPKSGISVQLTLQDASGVWQAYTKANLFNTSNLFDRSKVFYYSTIHPASIGFNIIDEQGNVFKFKRGDYHKTNFTVPRVSDADPAAQDPNAEYSYTYYPTERWVLYQIVTYTGAIVNYNYIQRDGISYPTHREEVVQESNQWFYENDPYWGHDEKFKRMADSAVIWTGGISQLTSIEYPNGTTVQFASGANTNHPRCDMPATYAVDSIIIRSGYDNQVKNELTYRMWYSYLGSAGGGNSNAALFPYSSPCSTIAATYNSVFPALGSAYLNTHLRLSLDSIELVGKNHATKELFYRFDYESTPLPKRLSSAQDWYGYYNGKYPTNTVNDDDNVLISSSSNPTSIPLHSFEHYNNSTITYGTDKTPDSNYLIACNLIMVRNGSGGSVSFRYKNHILSNPANAYTPGDVPDHDTMRTDMEGQDANDGLCIGSIIEEDGYNYENTVVKHYSFSGGERFFQGGYYWYPLLFEDCCNGSHPWKVLHRVYTNSNIQPVDYFNGSNHGYSHAVVTTKNFNLIMLKKEEYDFTNLMDKDYSSVSNLKMTLGVTEQTFQLEYFAQYRMGKMWQYKLYDNNNYLISKTLTNYSALTGPYINTGSSISIDSRKSFNYWLFNYLTDHATAYTSTNILRQYYVSEAFLPNSEETTTYTASGAQTVTKSFTYDSRDNISSVTQTDSRGRTIQQNYSYNYNATSSNPTNIPDHTNFRITSDRKLITSNQTVFLDYAKYLRYCDVNFTATANLLRSHTLNTLVSATPVSSVQSNLRSVTSGTVWDSLGNVVEQKKNDILTTASIWDLRVGKLVATVPNATYADIAYTSFEGTFKPLGWRDDNKGNWDFDGSNIALPTVGNTTKPITGRYEYHLGHSGGTLVPNNIVSKNNLTSGKKYVVSFWASAQPDVAEKTSGSNASISVTWIKNVNNWNLYTGVFTSIGGKIDISNSGYSTIKVDELRLYPADASMTTTCYEPLFGPSCISDGIGNIIYQEYDVMGRLRTTRDINNNIISVQKTFIRDKDQ